MRATFNCFLVLCLALMLGATAAADELVTNGGFETGNFSGWDISGSQLTAAITDDPMLVHSGSYAASIQTAWNGSAVLSQMLPTIDGGTYDLVFWLKWVDYPPDHFLVRWNNTPILYIGDRQSFPYERFEISGLRASGTSLLSFEFASNQDSTWYFDDVSVKGPSAPEPGTLLLIGTGVVGLAGVMRGRLT